MIRNNILRTLARSHKWQSLYARAKELNLELFNNKSDLSKIQTIFLDYLNLYENLYQDIAMNEEHINREKLKDDELVNAYLVFRRRKRNKKDKRKQKKPNNTSVPSLIFSRNSKNRKKVKS